jgi:hypothetical protein
MPDTEKLVTISRLKALLDAYGATPECWPEEERAAAAALIETSAEARMLTAEAAALDSLLDKVPEPEVSAALTSRVRSMILPVTDNRSGGLFAGLAEFLRPQTPRAWQGAVAMAGILGIIAGMGISPLVFDRTDPAPRIVATSEPVTIVPVVATTDGVDTTSASLAPDLTALSLTGDDVAGGDSDETEQQSDGGEFAVAGVPLY